MKIYTTSWSGVDINLIQLSRLCLIMESDPHSVTQCASLNLLHSWGRITWCRQLLLSLVSELSCSNIHCSRFNSTDESTKTEDADIWERACNFNQAINLIWKTSQATGTSVFGSLDEFHYCWGFSSLIGPVKKPTEDRDLWEWVCFLFNQAINLIWTQVKQLALPLSLDLLTNVTTVNAVILWLDLF